jgi:pyridoxamine 5'-phosphate oxidase
VTKEELFALGWGEIVLATKQRKHPFHTATYSTLGADGPDSRVVTLRYAKDWVVGFHADVRSPKAQQSISDSRVCWLFYSSPHKLQVRGYGRTVVHHLDDVAREAWEASKLLSRRCYLAPLAPSSVTSLATNNIPEFLADREPVEEEAVPGFENFSVVRTHLTSLEVLKLEFGGQWRARFGQDGVSEWLAP